jgi:hypothetical protein
LRLWPGQHFSISGIGHPPAIGDLVGCDDWVRLIVPAESDSLPRQRRSQIDVVVDLPATLVPAFAVLTADRSAQLGVIAVTDHDAHMCAWVTITEVGTPPFDSFG